MEGKTPMRWIDIPPNWLAAHLLALWVLGEGGPQIEGRVWDALGVCLIVLGLALMLWSVVWMVRARTTPIPHRMPSALVTGGPFLFSRNPIYLGDMMILAGAVAWSGAVLGLLLLPLLLVILTRRFIIPEEKRLTRAFGPAYESWARRVRRWL